MYVSCPRKCQALSLGLYFSIEATFLKLHSLTYEKLAATLIYRRRWRRWQQQDSRLLQVSFVSLDCLRFLPHLSHPPKKSHPSLKDDLTQRRSLTRSVRPSRRL